MARHGVFVEGHSVAFDWAHAYIKIVPADPDYFIARWPGIFSFGRRDASGDVYATIGAGPGAGGRYNQCIRGGCLVAGWNRNRDQDESLGKLVHIAIGGLTPDQEKRLIEELIATASRYQNNLCYCPFPGNCPVADYNSNSFSSGLLDSVGVSPPDLNQAEFPGWQNPIPHRAFAEPLVNGGIRG
jgi:hypothetical protein